MDFANEYAPEHLGIMTRDNAGAAGPHRQRRIGVPRALVGATGRRLCRGHQPRAAHRRRRGHVYGPLSIESFGRKLQVQELTRDGLSGLRQTVGTLASAEGLPGHRRRD